MTRLRLARAAAALGLAAGVATLVFPSSALAEDCWYAPPNTYLNSTQYGRSAWSYTDVSQWSGIA